VSDEPLDPATLDALRSVLHGAFPPEMESTTLALMLQRAFDAPVGADLHGDRTADELIPADWPVPDDPGASVGADPTATTANETHSPSAGDVDDWAYPDGHHHVDGTSQEDIGDHSSDEGGEHDG
jgi:hypothetical protein